MEKRMIEEFINGIGTGLTVEKIATKVYRFLSGKIEDVCILNDKYIVANGRNFQLIRCRSKGSWKVKEF